MSEIVDRVAKVLVDSMRSQDGAFIDLKLMAKAVIEAMREPTKEMLDKGAEAFAHYTDEQESTHLWQAMIDEALK